jgi:signal transduction histidine kinase
MIMSQLPNPQYPVPPQVPQGYQPYGYQAVAVPGNGMAVASMVLGILSVFLFWLWAVVPILAIIFGGVSMSATKKVGMKSNGMAVAGLTLGIIFTAIFAILLMIGMSA